MITIPETVSSGVKKYMERLKQEIPVEKTLLFSSYARGTCSTVFWGGIKYGFI